MAISTKHTKKINIEEFYAVNIKSLWIGLKQEHISVWFLCIYFLFEYIRPQILYPAIDILPWAQLFLLLTIFSAFADKSVGWNGNILNKQLVLFYFILVLSAVFSIYPSASWEARNTMLSWLIVYFLVINIVNTEKRLILFLLAYLLFNLKMAQHGAIDWAARGFAFSGYGLIGSPGWFRNSGEYAIQMLIYGSLAIAMVISLKDYWGRYKKWFMYSAAAAGYITVVGSSSRGAQLALAIIILWGVLKLKGGLKILLTVAALSTVLYSIIPDEQMARFKQSGDDKTSLQRLAYWDIGLDLAKENPFLGIGYKNWIPYVKDLYPDGVGPLEKIEVSHSIFIEVAAEMGYTGFVIYILMILTAFIVNAQTRKLTRNSDNKLIFNLTYGLDAGLVGFIVAGAFVTVLYYPFFWVQIAMITMLNNLTKNSKLAQTVIIKNT